LMLLPLVEVGHFYLLMLAVGHQVLTRLGARNVYQL